MPRFEKYTNYNIPIFKDKFKEEKKYRWTSKSSTIAISFWLYFERFESRIKEPMKLDNFEAKIYQITCDGTIG